MVTELPLKTPFDPLFSVVGFGLSVELVVGFDLSVEMVVGFAFWDWFVLAAGVVVTMVTFVALLSPAAFFAPLLSVAAGSESLKRYFV